jgi:hypothetical protein
MSAVEVREAQRIAVVTLRNVPASTTMRELAETARLLAEREGCILWPLGMAEPTQGIRWSGYGGTIEVHVPIVRRMPVPNDREWIDVIPPGQSS